MIGKVVPAFSERTRNGFYVFIGSNVPGRLFYLPEKARRLIAQQEENTGTAHDTGAAGTSDGRDV